MSLGRDLPCKGTRDSKKAGKEREKRGQPRARELERLGGRILLERECGGNERSGGNQRRKG